MRTRCRRFLVVAAGTALASMALLASVAEAAPPAAPYQDFAGCPSPAENPLVAYCAKYEFSGGHFKLGNRNIPVTQPILVRGGSRVGNGEFLANAEGGIAPVRQTVQGGLVGLTGYPGLDELIAGSEALKVYATIESAGTPGQLETFPFELPIKVHLENPLLGKSCYVGSDSQPIHLDLTTGTTNPPAPTQPITGVESSEFGPEPSRPEVLFSEGGVFVDNSFAVPGASGCQLNLGSLHINIDKLIDRAAALPSPAGGSEAVLDFSLSLADPHTIYPGS